IDESHVTVPQVSGMYAGDESRKKNLIEYGFRLPSALDNRPLKFEEFEERVGQTVYTSATPGSYEKEYSQKVVEQIIRPTGLIDPLIEVRPIAPSRESFSQVLGNNPQTIQKTSVEPVAYLGQVQDFIAEAEKE